MMPRAVLGVDIGTSSTKAVLVDFSGRILGRADREHAVDRPVQGRVEMDPALWWSELGSLTAELLDLVPGVRVEAVCVSAMGPCVVVSDEENTVLRPAILYGIDTRTSRMLDDVAAELGGTDAVRARCGSQLSTQSAGVKLAWVARNEPEVWAKTSRFATASSWMVERLSGEYVLDHHSASHCTPLYDVHENRWIDEWAAALAPGLALPKLLWAHEQAGVLTETAARELGLPAGIPVAVGSIDAWAEAVSVGVGQPGRLFVQYGTTMFLLVPTEHPCSVPGLWTTSNVPGVSGISAGTATSGAITEWVRGLTGAGWEDLLKEAEHSGVGAQGLLMLPYFAGERTPMADPDARGLVAGLTIRHTRGDLYRAVLESTAFAVRHNIEAIRSGGVAVNSLVAAGGGLRGRVWPQIVSDVCDLDQIVPTVSIGAAFGAAFLAAGLIESVSIADWNPPSKTLHPDPDATALYDVAYADFRDLYTGTRKVVHRLANRF